MNDRILLLDTHIWIWLVNGDRELLGSESLGHIEKAAGKSALLLSAISAWEVAMLEAKGRLRLAGDCMDWVKTAIKVPGMSLCNITPEIAVNSSRLPGNFHGDPADRIIVATAREKDVVLVTRDRRILEYGAEGYLSVMKA